MRAGSGAFGCILLCIAGVLASCSGSDGGASATTTTSSSTTTTTAPPGPMLDTTTDDVEAAMRSLLEFAHWAEQSPDAALEQLDRWLVPGGPYYDDVEGALSDQAARELVATGSSEILEVRADEVDDDEATVLVWKRSDHYNFVGPSETLPSPPFERTLFVYDLERDPDGSWRIFARRIAVPA